MTMKSRGIASSFKAAFKGLFGVVQRERNMRIHILSLITILSLGAAFQVNRLEWAILLLTSGLVIGAEALNSALEDLCDALHPDHHPLIGRAKDTAAGAVLACAITALVIGLLVFLPYISRVFNS